MRIAAQAGVAPIEATARLIHGHVSYWLGDHANALAHWHEALRIGREHQVAYLMLWAHFCAVLVEGARGDCESAISSLREGLELSARVGDRVWRARMLNTLGWSTPRSGTWTWRSSTTADASRNAATGAIRRSSATPISTSPTARLRVHGAIVAQGVSSA